MLTHPGAEPSLDLVEATSAIEDLDVRAGELAAPAFGVRQARATGTLSAKEVRVHIAQAARRMNPVGELMFHCTGTLTRYVTVGGACTVGPSARLITLQQVETQLFVVAVSEVAGEVGVRVTGAYWADKPDSRQGLRLSFGSGPFEVACAKWAFCGSGADFCCALSAHAVGASSFVPGMIRFGFEPMTSLLVWCHRRHSRSICRSDALSPK